MSRKLNKLRGRLRIEQEKTRAAKRRLRARELAVESAERQLKEHTALTIAVTNVPKHLLKHLPEMTLAINFIPDALVYLHRDPSVSIQYQADKIAYEMMKRIRAELVKRMKQNLGLSASSASPR
jgi:hypothetical protein